MSRHNKKNGIPDRWLNYKAVGKPLDGTRFVAFKVPLKQSLNRLVASSDVFGPWELLDTLSKDNHELGLIIDLTFTKRYYSAQDIPESLLFVKIFTAGHQVPSNDTILRFKQVVRRFLRENADNDKLIGVHCTHGLNRTGYLVCRYLIDVDGMDPEDAIYLFNSSRGHAIERQNYLDDLQRGPKRSNEGIDKCDLEPERGCARHRPHADNRDERRPHADNRDERRPHADNRDERRPHADNRDGRRPHADNRDERRQHFSEPWSGPHRPFPPRGSNHPSHHRQLHEGLLPDPPPLFRQPMGTPPHPYRLMAPHSGGQSRPRYPPPPPLLPEPEWQEPRRRGGGGRGLLPITPHPLRLQRYVPQWRNESNSYNGAEDNWGGSRTRHNERYTH